jgi:hypothetical protein
LATTTARKKALWSERIVEASADVSDANAADAKIYTPPMHPGFGAGESGARTFEYVGVEILGAQGEQLES